MKEDVRIGYWGIKESKNLRIVLGKDESMYRTHCHNFYEFEFILSGKGRSTLNGRTYEMKRGMAVFVSPTDVHNYISEDKIILYSIRFRLDCVSWDILERFIHVENCIAYLDEQEISHYIKMCEIIEQEFDQENAYIDGLLACLLIRFSKYFKQKPMRPQRHVSIKQAVTYLHSHFKENPSLAEVADMLYMSKSHFCKLFHKEMGISYKNYLRELKLEYAARLLTTTELSSTEVAAESGYGSQAHSAGNLHSAMKCHRWLIGRITRRRRLDLIEMSRLRNKAYLNSIFLLWFHTVCFIMMHSCLRLPAGATLS